MKLNRVRFLKSVMPFSGLPEAELEALADRLAVAEYPANTTLFVQMQSRVDNLYILVDGALQLFFQEDGERTLQGFLEEGDTFGGISMLLNDGVAIRTVRVTETSRLLLLPRPAFLELCRRYPDVSDFFASSFGKQMLDKSYQAIVSKLVTTRNEVEPPLFNQAVRSICRTELVACDRQTTLREAARRMTEYRQSAILVRDGEGRHVGIVTDRDFRQKVVAEGLDGDTPVAAVMSSPLIAIDADAPIFEAILTMVEKDIKHLAVVDGETVVGITSNNRLLIAQGQSPVTVMREIREADRPEALFGKQREVAPLVRDLMERGARADHLNRMISTIADTFLGRLIDFAFEKHGPPPARFAFLIMGSEGRKEQTLKTDQDNAIVYEDVPKEEAEAVRDYFLAFGKTVCTWLDKVGYAFCNGKVMAMNPKWNQPLSVWKGYFRKWVHTPEPMAVMHSTIFFDFETGFGDAGLTRELRSSLGELLGERSGVFFYHLANDAMRIKPPLGFFRNFVVESKGEHANTLDIKKAMTPIVDFARSYALENGVEATNTLERLHQLRLTSVLKEGEYEELVQGYRYLMQMRIARQLEAIIEEKTAPDNHINPRRLTQIEQKMLKEVFAMVGEYQKKLSLHFTASA